MCKGTVVARVGVVLYSGCWLAGIFFFILYVLVEWWSGYADLLPNVACILRRYASSQAMTWLG